MKNFQRAEMICVAVYVISLFVQLGIRFLDPRLNSFGGGNTLVGDAVAMAFWIGFFPAVCGFIAASFLSEFSRGLRTSSAFLMTTALVVPIANYLLSNHPARSPFQTTLMHALAILGIGAVCMLFAFVIPWLLIKFIRRS